MGVESRSVEFSFRRQWQGDEEFLQSPRMSDPEGFARQSTMDGRGIFSCSAEEVLPRATDAGREDHALRFLLPIAAV